jgi:4-diphosphocytidyl-2-C-methyl-D-erythritol kinase
VGKVGGVEAQRALAKLTLSLRVVGRRDDGYHLLEAEMVTLDLADRLVFDGAGDGIEVVGPFGDVPPGSDNLVARALVAVDRRAFVRLEKSIRPGAGLGGGSADAAAVLRWAGCTDHAVAATLGADVPFCLTGGRAMVSGVGEVVDPLPLTEGVTYTLLTPPFGVSTADVYRAWDRLGGPSSEGPNDLEPAALAVEPRLGRWRDRLGNATGLRPALAGSGSTWFVPGAFADVEGAVVVRTASA